MLEEILKSINANLERIATSMEGNKNKCEETIAVETQAPTINTISVMQTAPVQQEIPTFMPVSAPAIPVANTQESFTQEQLAVAMSNAVTAGKMNVIMEILGKFNVQALTQINPADYNKLAVMLKEAGVEI